MTCAFFVKLKTNGYFPFSEILTSVVAWPSINNTLTLKCNQGNVILQQSEDQCDFKPKCVLRYTNKSALFFCSSKLIKQCIKISIH